MNNLERLNAYRAAQGLNPIAAWRPARHQHFLDQIVVPWEQMIANANPPVNYAFNEGTNSAGEPATGTLKDVIHSRDFSDGDISEAAKIEKIAPYKTWAKYAPSSVDKPCAFIHSFLDAHPDLTRKQAMHALALYGINYSTARTQYQKWFAGR